MWCVSSFSASTKPGPKGKWFFKLPEIFGPATKIKVHAIPRKTFFVVGAAQFSSNRRAVFGVKLWGVVGWSLWSVHTSRFDLIHDSSNEHFGRVSSSKTTTSTYSTSTNFEKQRIHLRMKVGSQHHNNHGVVGSQHHNIHLRICEIWTCFVSSRWINYVIHDGPYSDPNLRT